MIVLGGDLNAQCNGDHATGKPVLGPHGIGKLNDNGIRLLSFALRNKLCLTGSMFQHPPRHKLTWKSNDGRTRTQIDHILVSSRFRSSAMDARVFRSADVYSDHFLVIANL